MPLKIKIPKQPTQGPESSQSIKPSKRRVYSEEEDDYPRDATDEPVTRPRPKRARTYESRGTDEAIPDEGEDEVEVNVDTLDDRAVNPLRTAASGGHSSSTSPAPTKSSRRSGKSERRGSTASSSRQKRKMRQVVWTDDEDEDADPLGLTAMDPDDDEFEPEPAVSKRSAGKTKATKANPKLSRTKAKVEEKEIVIRDERKLLPSESPVPKDKPSTSRLPLKRAPSSDEIPGGNSATAALDVPEDTAANTEEAEPPPPKKRKLPPIKKNKTSTVPSTPAVAKPATNAPKVDTPTPSKDPNGPVGVAARKPAASMGAADFDLRDANVYAQLFNKPVKQQPDSGLNRRQREEERRRQLNNMRDEARAKRAEEAKQTFDLQAAHEKILRFEEKLRAHNSIALYPNVLGAFWKDPRR
ncbi:hypothetical protein DAEQUDRAFT_764869 [Daedalea quercina L-15889]|uniref:Uncharacterized protein n=1 Tax=Daedalea quercina L-15889 TaxID=1314783 RepID=A0A165QZH4_9APHY|nr:hypothetical protein DAEQUDRAFT_764869 [Daedalea quercina L-15889]